MAEGGAAERIAVWARVVVVALSALAVGTFVVLALVRMSYPFELEWMEGGTVDHVRRVLSGRPLYVEPSLSFTSYIYTPLYFWVSSGFAAVMGVGFAAPRLVSVLSTLACFAALFVLVRRESGSSFGGVVAAGVFAATFAASGSWFDLARVDMLFLALVLWSAFLLRRRDDVLHHVLAAVLASLAFMTKQSALLVAAPLMVGVAATCRGWLRAVFPAVTAGLVALAAAAMHALTNGWFTYYVFELPRQHPLNHAMWVDFWVHDLLAAMSVAVLTTIVYLVTLGGERRFRDLFFHACLLAGLVGASWSARLHTGGWLNSLIPAHAALSLYLALGVTTVLSRWRSTSASAAVPLLACGVCAAQMLGLAYAPARELPSQDDAAAGRSLVRVMERIEGPVYLTNHGYLPAMAGKRTHAQGMAVADVLRSEDVRLRGALLDEILTAIREQRFAAVIVSERGLVEGWIMPELERHYRHRGDVFVEPDVFWPVTGHTMRPAGVYLPRR